VSDLLLNFFGCQQTFLLLVCRKNVSGAYVVSAHFGKQQINLVNPIIDFTSLFITGGPTNARKRLFEFHLMNTKDQDPERKTPNFPPNFRLNYLRVLGLGFRV
jgi:hypothetical protein